jgi:hypothetical protein
VSVLALPRGRVTARVAAALAALAALALIVALSALGARAAARALDRREEVLRAENAWLRARLSAMDARLRELETRADVGASAVVLPEGPPARPPDAR